MYGAKSEVRAGRRCLQMLIVAARHGAVRFGWGGGGATKLVDRIGQPNIRPRTVDPVDDRTAAGDRDGTQPVDGGVMAFGARHGGEPP